MRIPLSHLAFGAVAALSLAPAPAGAVSVPPQFVVESAAPGVVFDIPTAIAFLPGGRMLVAEKRGRVWAVENGVKYPTPLWQGENEVLDESDRGLLSIAVDPGYPTNHYIYLLYTVDPDSNGVDGNNDAFGRLTRYTVGFADSNTVDPASRTILMGVDWRNGPVVGSPTHTVGDLQWGTDGSLLVSAGEGANIFGVDAGGLDPQMFGPTRTDPVEDIGAFRAQYIGSLAGKILRIDPATGHGYPSNPYWDGDGASVRSRVWCYGLRQPFRFGVRPGSGSANPAVGDPGTLFIGDVGWNTWEEQNIARQGGRNFGWPCYEGLLAHPGYQAANPVHHGCDSLGLGDNTGVLTAPAMVTHHFSGAQSTPPGPDGSAAVGGVFYSAAIYPALYQNRYFFADYVSNWIRMAEVDGNDDMVAFSDFADDADGPVDLAIDPTSGDIHYVAILAGEVRRIRWTGQVGTNNPPQALAMGGPTWGSAPLAVAFSSAGTIDPDLDPLTFSWNFGDGVGSSQPHPAHTYVTGGTYAAVLTVSDGFGGLDRDTVVVAVIGGAGPFPTTPVLDDFNRPDGTLGGSWTGTVAGAVISGNLAGATCCEILPVWNGGVHGADQEAYFTFASVQPEQQGLMLKVQGTNATSGYLGVRYDGDAQQVLIETHVPGEGATLQGSFPGVFADGDWFGARAWSNGSVEVFKNGVRIGIASMGAWPYAALGGRIGFTLEGVHPARIDDLGGGDIVLNTPPTASILTPADSSFFVEGGTLRLWGRGRDIEQTPASLGYEWRLDLHHGVHVHPGTFSASGVTASYPVPSHDDGTGVWYEIRLRVIDALGLADTARVDVFPEVDLDPGWVVVTPEYPGTTTPADYRFKLHNLGRMVAPLSRWRLVGGGQLLAEGDATVPALDSVTVEVTVPPLLAPGDYTLDLTVDALGVVVETAEGNNTSARLIRVVEGPGTVSAPVPGGPRALALSNPYPSPSEGHVSLALDLPRAARVAFSVHDLQGRRVWREPERTHDAGRRMLVWDGTTESGAPTATGIYLARVTVEGRTLVRRLARLR